MADGLRQRRPRQRNKRYLGIIAQLPSVISLRSPCEVCHVRYGDLAQGKPPTGMAEKPSDKWCLPLTPDEHRLGNDSQHSTGEREWWAARGIDPVRLCQELYAAWESGADVQQMIMIIHRARARM
jgi:hypothetical protein